MKGRGAITNPAGRFERFHYEKEDDADGPADTLEDTHPNSGAVPTTVTIDATKSILTRNESPDIPFDRSLNPYRGCEHGCIYCYARPGHAHLGFSPGLDFESRLVVKPRAGELLAATLAKRRYRPQMVALGTHTDPYQPIERHYRITRSLLEVLAEARHPVMLVTKSASVTRDLDVLAAMAREQLVNVALSLTTLDGELARQMEPRASSPERRLAAVATLAAAGIPTAVFMAPVIPGLTDIEIEAVARQAVQHGAQALMHILVRLPGEVAGLFEEWLNVHRPHSARKILNLIRQCRGGALNHSAFGTRMTGEGPIAELVAKRLSAARRRHGLAAALPPLEPSAFRRLPADRRQLELFFD